MRSNLRNNIELKLTICSKQFRKLKLVFLTFPEGMGLRQVLDITASRSASYHMLRVPAAPAPIATAIKEIDELTKLMFSGEIIIPTMHVNITRDITLGFISFRNDLIIVANSDVKFFSFAKCCSIYFILGSSSKV